MMTDIIRDVPRRPFSPLILTYRRSLDRRGDDARIPASTLPGDGIGGRTNDALRVTGHFHRIGAPGMARHRHYLTRGVV